MIFKIYISSAGSGSTGISTGSKYRWGLGINFAQGDYIGIWIRGTSITPPEVAIEGTIYFNVH
jgi:hypothetical protein